MISFNQNQSIELLTPAFMITLVVHFNWVVSADGKVFPGGLLFNVTVLVHYFCIFLAVGFSGALLPLIKRQSILDNENA